MEKISLIHPIYLDVPMLVSFLAAIEGGVAFNKTVQKNVSEGDGRDVGLTGGAKGLLGALGVSLSAQVGERHNTERNSHEAEFRSHTEASLAIILYNKLKNDHGYIKSLDEIKDFDDVRPGDLVELSGIIQKNAVDAFVDYLSAVVILRELGVASADIEQAKSNDKNRTSKSPEKSDHTAEYLKRVRKVICEDRERTPISNAVMFCEEIEGGNAIITLRRENLRDLTLSELHKNSVKVVVGKVTRIVDKGQKVISFENYGMAMTKPEILTELFDNFSKKEQRLNLKFTEVEINGPAVQILPLMIFV